MKKLLFAGVFVLLMVFVIVGCNKNNEGNVTVGGWTLNTSVKNTIPEQQKDLFDKALSNHEDKSFKPIAYLGSQVVSGTNYMYLCTSNSSFKVVTVYSDLKGNVTIRQVEDFEIEDYANVEQENAATEITGGWQADSFVGESTLNNDEREMFDSATEKLLGVNYKPVTVLATQLVAGTNYAVLAVSETVTESPVYNISVVTIYKNLEGKSEVTSVANIDLAKYNE